MIGSINNSKAKYGISMEYARCDNAIENEDFERACKQEGIGIQFQYIVPGTPQ